MYRIVYCSRNRLQGTPEAVAAEIDEILAVSRRNNEANDVTGALLFNGFAFAQVLEGQRDAVEISYAKLRFDPRHSHVVVLERAHQLERNFANWTMAYSDAESPEIQALDFSAMEVNPAGFAAEILQLLKHVVDA